jgi:hypothetical protein
MKSLEVKSPTEDRRMAPQVLAFLDAERGIVRARRKEGESWA